MQRLFKKLPTTSLHIKYSYEYHGQDPGDTALSWNFSKTSRSVNQIKKDYQLIKDMYDIGSDKKTIERDLKIKVSDKIKGVKVPRQTITDIDDFRKLLENHHPLLQR